MRYCGIQPQYFPRLHYFARILESDIYCIRDDVQFVRKHHYPGGRIDKSYQAHSPIKQSFGKFFLALPIKHNSVLTINKINLAYDYNWMEEHLKTIKISYKRAQNFNLLYPQIEEIFNRHFQTISDLNIATILWGILLLLNEKDFRFTDLNIARVNQKLKSQSFFRLKKIVKAADVLQSFDTSGMNANDKILTLITNLGGSEDYCGGTSMQAYIDKEYFRKAGIKLVVQDWTCRQYGQLFIKQSGFIPDLSIIDLLMNTSNGEAARIIRG